MKVELVLKGLYEELQALDDSIAALEQLALVTRGTSASGPSKLPTQAVGRSRAAAGRSRT